MLRTRASSLCANSFFIVYHNIDRYLPYKASLNTIIISNYTLKMLHEIL